MTVVLRGVGATRYAGGFRWCSRCLHSFRGPARRGWTATPDGLHICPRCSRAEATHQPEGVSVDLQINLPRAEARTPVERAILAERTR